MAVQKIDITIARLRLILADVMAKESQLNAMRGQFRDQLRKAVDFSIYGDAPLDASLGLMNEIQQRVSTTEDTIRDLAMIRVRAERELESLQLTKRIEAAKSELRDLLDRQAELERDSAAATSGVASAELGEQIDQLRQQINEASELAAKSLERR